MITRSIGVPVDFNTPEILKGLSSCQEFRAEIFSPAVGMAERIESNQQINSCQQADQEVIPGSLLFRLQQADGHFQNLLQ
ncbi:hypothetical protein M3P05_05580 [Sansalvadorimonas sp. 2012CJ34-2]|uniref:Uncharacterized protein n=1 Tax=Parendozoicomonas callyspongiae TaxID=2942213 RepID=A0ABT0PDH9_9GAMM|nr:hypothetical protein [Sansalvadorimonas sp. 2012CJ34-2]MCL6269415.1 hypothetical protein [Sansalvadorimonas sp. 2012CJ34-2]